MRRRELIDEKLKAAGAGDVLIDEPAAVEEAARVIGKGSVRLAVDTVGGDAAAMLAQMLSDRVQQLITYSAASGQPLAINELRPCWRSA